MTCYDEEEVSAIAQAQTACEIQALDLTSMERVYKESQDRRYPESLTSLGTILGCVTAGLIIGFVAGTSTR